MPGNSNRNAIVFAILAVLFWSTSPTAFKLGLRYQDGYQMLTGASLTSTLVLGILLIVKKKTGSFKSLKWKDLAFSALMGVLNPVAYYLILFKAYSILPAQVAQPLNMVWPIVLVIIAIPLLGQKLSWKNIGALLLSFTGVVLVSMQGGTGSMNPDNPLGIILALSTSVIWAFYFILNAKVKRDPVLSLFLNFIFASTFLIIGGLIKGNLFPGSANAWFAACYVGIFEMGITFVLWLVAMQLSTSTSRISNLVYIAPFLNLILVHLILHEAIYMTTLYGIIFLVSGILIQNRFTRYATISR